MAIGLDLLGGDDGFDANETSMVAHTIANGTAGALSERCGRAVTHRKWYKGCASREYSVGECELVINLNRPGPFRPGEPLEGTLTLRSPQDLPFRVVRVGLGYVTTTRDKRRAVMVHETVVHEGPLRAGTCQEHPVTFTVPNGPMGYAGHLITVEWFVMAWARRHAAMSMVPFIPPAAQAVQYLELISARREDYVAGRGAGLNTHTLQWMFHDWLLLAPVIVLSLYSLVTVAGGTLFALFGALLLALSGDTVLIQEVVLPGLLAAGAGLPGIALTMVVLVWVGAWRLARHRLGRVHIDVSPSITGPGDPVTVRVALSPRADIRVRAIRVYMRGIERALHGRARSRRLVRHTVHNQAVVIARELRLRSGESRAWSHTFALPDDAPLTYQMGTSAIEWLVDVRVCRRGPDVMYGTTLTVAPPERE